VRVEMLEVMQTDYIKFARARGLKDRAIHVNHALKNTLVPVVTIIGINIGGLVAFSLITETVFQWPGTGLLFIQAVEFVDVPVMAAYLCFVRSPGAMIAAFVTSFCILVALFAPFVAPYDPFDPSVINLWDGKLPPVWIEGSQPQYLLGTDNQGRDMLSTIIYGGRLSILIGVAAVALGLVLGVSLGVLSGYLGGWVDTVIMRVADVQFTIPGILLAILINGIARNFLPIDVREAWSIYVVIFAIGLSDWPQYARVARGATMVEVQKEYVLASRVMAMSSFIRGFGGSHSSRPLLWLFLFLLSIFWGIGCVTHLIRSCNEPS